VEWEKVQVDNNITADEIIEGYTDKPVIKYLGNKACYIPSKDEVNMPPVNFFDSVDEFYSTLFHELSHSVLHETRMNRKIDTVFGSKLYTEQELEAEFASAFLCNESGIDNTLENSAAYIQSWMKSFKDNPAMIITAASKAQKTADYILGMNEEKGD
jgi:antirestriction protein ArdC